MLTASSYLAAWLLYAGSVVGLIYTVPGILHLPRTPMFLLSFRLLLAGLLLTPVATELGAETLAPAIIVTVFEFFVSGSEAALRAGLPLLLVFGVLAVVLLLIYLLSSRPKK